VSFLFSAGFSSTVSGLYTVVLLKLMNVDVAKKKHGINKVVGEQCLVGDDTGVGKR
jgi:hypothetical protein